MERSLDLPLAHIELALTMSRDDGRWQWSYSSWLEDGTADAIDSSYQIETRGCSARFLDDALDRLLLRLRAHAWALEPVEPF